MAIEINLIETYPQSRRLVFSPPSFLKSNFSSTGYIYSALNPIIYFTLNHNSLRQSISCSLCSRLVSMRRLLRVSLGINNSAAMAPPSSTNEAALGAFNPRYIKPKQFCKDKDKESSHYVY